MSLFVLELASRHTIAVLWSDDHSLHVNTAQQSCPAAARYLSLGCAARQLWAMQVSRFTSLIILSSRQSLSTHCRLVILFTLNFSRRPYSGPNSVKSSQDCRPSPRARAMYVGELRSLIASFKQSSAHTYMYCLGPAHVSTLWPAAAGSRDQQPVRPMLMPQALSASSHLR